MMRLHVLFFSKERRITEVGPPAWCSFPVRQPLGRLISDALPFGRRRYGEPNAVANAVSYAKFRSRSHDAVIRVHDEAGNVIETHEHVGDFKEP
jgi:hypothetical protein